MSVPRRFVAWLLTLGAIGYGLILPAGPATADLVGPMIDVWYGLDQTFALPGTTQPWINIIGNVSDDDGVASLSYRLNGGDSIPLTLGTATSDLADRRLAGLGDFNINLAIADLDGSAGSDTVVITAVDAVANESTVTVMVDYVAPAGVWPLPVVIDWSTATTISEVAQVIDGDWDLTAGGVRTLDPAYDRNIVVGDVAWSEYVVTAPVTIHALGFPGGGDVGAVGFLAGWQGYTDAPFGVYADGACGGSAAAAQPKCGWEPLGVAARYLTTGVLELLGEGGNVYDSKPMTLDVGTTYWFKLRVEASPVGAGNIFNMKVWEQGTAEPSEWAVTGQEPYGPHNGAVLLTSHHDDVTFGNVSIQPLTAPSDDLLLVEPNGRWHVRVPGHPDYTFFYGVPGDVPLFGDWDGDGLDTPGMWRQGPGGGLAYLTNELPPDGGAASAEFDFFFGIPGDDVFAGDWNGDGIDTLGINRDGHIFLADANGTGGVAIPTDYDFFFGVPGDRAFGGDGDGNGSDGVFLHRESSGFIYYTNETPVGPGAVAATAGTFFFGDPSDEFVTGDWNSDGVDTGGIFRDSNTTVYLTNSNGSGGGSVPTDDSYVWGAADWSPVAGVTGLGN